MAETEICPICRERPIDPNTRKDMYGTHWCMPCQDEFDSIDWDVIAEKHMEEGF